MIKTIFAAAMACAVATGVSAATYKTYSNVKEGAGNHSLWFSGVNNPSGAIGNNVAGQQANHFKFERNADGYGVFNNDDPLATTLTGQLANWAGQTFDLILNLTKTSDPGSYKTPSGFTGNPATDWEFYNIAAGSMITFLGGPGSLKSFDISMRGAPLAVQVGVGANDKDKDLFGLSTWIWLDEKNCTSNCERYAGDINVWMDINNPILPPVPLPASGLLLLGALGGAGLIARRRKST